MPRTSKYTKDVIAQMVKDKGLTSRSQLQKVNGSAYNMARKQGWLEELFPATTASKVAKRVIEEITDSAPKRKRRAKVKRPSVASLAPSSATITITGIERFADAQSIMTMVARINGANADLQMPEIN